MISTYSFKKESRLLNKNDFSNMRFGSRFFVCGVLVFYVKPNNLNRDRIGLAISKKAGNAVKRNKINRKIKKEKLSHKNIMDNLPKAFLKAYRQGFKP